MLPSSSFSKEPSKSGDFACTTPTFDAPGHDGGPLSSLPSCSSWELVRPSWAAWQACKPAACPGLITRPSGSVTVVPWISLVERPSGSSRPPVVGVTSTDNPAGESAFAVSGTVVNTGANPKSSQPVIPAGSSLALWYWNVSHGV